MRAESAVDPTRSEKITVTWRCSARSSGTLGELDVVAVSTEGALALALSRSAAIAASSLRRCPSAVTPSCFRCSSVKLGRTVSSISFSRNAASYFPRPRLRSQTTMSIACARNQWPCAHHGLPRRVCPGGRDVRQAEADSYPARRSIWRRGCCALRASPNLSVAPSLRCKRSRAIDVPLLLML